MHATRRQFVRLVGFTGLAGAAVSLASCDDATWDGLARRMDGDGGAFQPPQSREIDEVTHVLNRLTFGPRPEDHARVSSIGVDAFIEEQLHPETIVESRRASWKLMGIETIQQPRAELFDEHPQTLLHDLSRAKLLRATYSSRQLEEIMVDFWTDHFNIVSAKDQCRWLKVADDRQVIRPHALGKFGDLLRASALSPAMLIYLDGHDNKVIEPGDKPNENYARELLELHTLGAAGGYTQQDVMEVARCLSGWTYGHTFLQPDRVRFIAEHHDDGEKIVLGQRISGGGGPTDLDRVMTILCEHPSTARFIARKLCRRFVSDEPEEESVDRAAARFSETNGDIRETLRAIFSSDAFMQSRGGLFKRPLRFVVSALRAADAATDCGRPVIGALERMGHLPYQYPTPDGYPMEPQPWLGTLLWRWNFALRLERNELGGTQVDRDRFTSGAGTLQSAAAHFLGRGATDDELAILTGSRTPLALALSSPAFQRY